MVQPRVEPLDEKPPGYIRSGVAMGSGGGGWAHETDPGNARAIRCYEKAGFRAMGQVQTPWPGLVDGLRTASGRTAVRMQSLRASRAALGACRTQKFKNLADFEIA